MRSPHVVALLVATLTLAGPACSSVIFGSRSATPTAARPGVPVDELLALDVDTLPTNSVGVERLRDLGVAIQRARDGEKTRLRAHRAELTADMIVVARAYRDLNPALSEWYYAAAGLLVGVDAAEPSFVEQACERVAGDLEAAGNANPDEAVAAIRWAVGPGTDLPPSGNTARAVVLRLAHVAAGVGPWGRYGDECDGGAFTRQAAALAVSDEVRSAGLADGLSTAANARTVGALAAIESALATAHGHNEPIVRAVEPMVADLEARLADAAVPLTVPPDLVVGDSRLEPPISFLPPPPVVNGGLGFTFRRVVLVRTDGVAVMVTPHVTLIDSSPVCPAIDAGWGYPGRPVVAFDQLGSIPPDALDGDTIPVLETDLRNMETWLSSQSWLPDDEKLGVAEGTDTPQGMSLIADGDTYFSTLRPVLGALRAVGYSPIALHTQHRGTGALDAVAVRLVAAPGVDDNLLIVREDGYLLQPYDPENLAAPVTVSRVESSPVLTVYRSLVDGFAAGRLDPDKPLTVRVDDNSVDYGILAHLLAGVGFERDLVGVTDDRGLLTAPIVMEADGAPRVLCPAGLRVAL